VQDDDLFGRSAKPVVEVPAEPAPSPLEPTFIQLPAVPDLSATTPDAPSPLSPAVFGSSSPAALAPTQADTTFPMEGAYVGATAEWQSSTAGAAVMEAPQPEETPLPMIPTPPVRRDQSSGKFMIIMLINLISYSIGVTGLLIYFLYFNQPATRSPIEEFPDNYGEQPGVTKKEKKSSAVFKRIPPDTNLPAHLQVALGNTIRFNALEVTPEKVEQKRVVHKYRNRDYQPQEAQEDSLILHLKLKNVSEDNVFYPTDPAFERKLKEGYALTNKPYTFLDLADKRDDEKKRFYGGNYDWILQYEKGETPRKGYVEGQEFDDKPLYPGEERKTVIYTDPDDHVIDHMRGYNGRFVWRVHLRKGLVKVKDREVSATGVIGVTFNKEDIR
jgi:hypothetical protein